MTQQVDRSITLHCIEGNAKKQYTIEISAVDAKGFEVRGINGRIGGTMSIQPKTPNGPVTRAEADRIFDALLGQKLRGGYHVASQPAAQIVGMQPKHVEKLNASPRPMLLNSITREEAEQLLKDPAWLLEAKYDGVRVHLRREGQSVTATSRTDKPVALEVQIVKAALQLPAESFVLDGEKVGDIFICFDILSRDGISLHQKGCEFRAGYYAEFLKKSPKAIVAAPVALTLAEKKAFFKTLEEKGVEGAVFKLKSAPYTAGRPNSNGPARKFKFVATASVIVARQHGKKRSVEIQLFDGTDLGCVTIPPNFKTLPSPGIVIEVRYLTAHRDGALVQAVYLGERIDVDPSACTIDQLQFKEEPRCPKAESTASETH